METGKRFRKDELYKEAMDLFNVKLDRRLKLEELEEQFVRLKNNANEPTVEDETEGRVPRTIRNVITGNTFGFLPNWESNPNLEVIEWETE